MTEERVQRRLAAILAADVVGYSRLIREDEEGTLAQVKDCLSAIIGPTIARYQGRIVKTMGDGVLVEFSSAVDAVKSAFDFQAAMADRNAELADKDRLEFRVGINLGDVVIDGGDIYGDGVNVAARLEGISEPGGICISGKVYEEVRDRMVVDLKDLGEQEVKNINRPVRVWGWSPKKTASATITPIDLELPDKPSIAVLPFENMSGDPEQEYFADGIAEDIITALSRFRWFFVIARNSSFKFKGHMVDVKQVAGELGVQYVLEGSVRKAASRVRITAQLIDASNDRHLWAERYDRDIEDIFAVQDEITSAIASSVGPEFVSAEAERAERKAPENFDSWDYAMRGNFHLWRISKDDVTQAQALFQSAIDLDPKNTLALVGLALAYTWQSVFGWTEDMARVRERAFDLAQRAVASDPRDAWAHAVSGYIHSLRRQSETAIRSLRRALELNPNLAFAEGMLGLAFAHKGEPENALPHVAKADRLSPSDPARVVWGMAYSWCALIEGDYERAVQYCRRDIEDNPTYPTPWRHLAASLGQLGRLDEAQLAVVELLKLVPGATIKHTIQSAPTSNDDHRDLFVEGLRKAGLPEQSDPPLLPEKPSIAVLPFENMSGDLEQEYFSDGITEDIITALSRIRQFFVIARNTTFTFKKRHVDVQTVAKELAVRYVLEGSVRKSGNRVRITAQLIDGNSGNHIWAERYDRQLEDIFEVQDEITQTVVGAIEPELNRAERERALQKPPETMAAWDYLQRGWWHLNKFGKSENLEAIRNFQRAIDIDPTFAQAHAGLAEAEFLSYFRSFASTPVDALDRALDAAKSAIALDEKDSVAFAVLGIIFWARREFALAIENLQNAVAANPSSARAHHWLGWVYAFDGRADEAIVEMELALRLSPTDPSLWRFTTLRALAYLNSDRLEQAAEWANRALQQPNAPNTPYIAHVIALSHLKRPEEARQAAETLLKKFPDVSIERVRDTFVFNRQEDADLWVEGLRKAGVPEN